MGICGHFGSKDTICEKNKNISVPEAVPYWSFDNADGLIFMEGLIQKNSVPLETGKVNLDVSLKFDVSNCCL